MQRTQNTAKKAFFSLEGGLQLTGAILFGHFMIALDNAHLTVLLQKNWYYRDLLTTACSCMLLLRYISLVNCILTRKWSWATERLKRIAGQIITGVGGASVIIYLISYLQFRYLDPEHVFGTATFLYIEYPVAVMIAVLINFLYAALSFTASRRQADKNIQHPQNNKISQSIIIAESGNRKVCIPIERIAYIKLESELTWIVTFDNELYRVEKSLGELMKMLGGYRFFRINRRTIIHILACEAFASEPLGKIRVKLVNPLSVDFQISQKTAPGFRKWILLSTMQ
jgi:DNA-binding LytR/AlgR family response regulator